MLMPLTRFVSIQVLTTNRQAGWCSAWRATCADDHCWEHVTLELALTSSGQLPLVGSMKTAVHVQKMLTRVAEVDYVYSEDGAQWKPIPTDTNPDEWPALPTPYFGVEVEVSPPVRARYLRIRQRLPRGAHGAKVQYGCHFNSCSSPSNVACKLMIIRRA